MTETDRANHRRMVEEHASRRAELVAELEMPDDITTAARDTAERILAAERELEKPAAA